MMTILSVLVIVASCGVDMTGELVTSIVVVSSEKKIAVLCRSAMKRNRFEGLTLRQVKR